MSEDKQPHKRRVRYKGTHPKNFKEKYKEHNPDKYSDAIERVIQKGNTPAGMHISICVKEILDFLAIKPGQIGFDATLGYGGHTAHMLSQLEGRGHIHATDVDPIEITRTVDRLASKGYGPDLFTAHNMSFSEIDKVAQMATPFNFVLADLGVSSMQIDNPDRGFSYKREGPLDLRLNPNKGISAAQRLENITRDELEGMLIENADEPHAALLAKAIVTQLKKGTKIQTTTALYEIIKTALTVNNPKVTVDEIKKTCQRTFQALRIDVNNEYEVLYEFLEKLPAALAPGGRVAILSFHSGEDRLVKKSFQRLLREGIYSEIASEPIRPSQEECNINSRARSTKMRWAIKA